MERDREVKVSEFNSYPNEEDEDSISAEADEET